MTSFIFKSFVFALAASTVFALAAPAPEVAALETNAQRLAAGLNPASPRNLKSTKVERRHVVAPSPSPSPCQKSGLRRLRRSAEQTYSGIICVQYPGNDTLIGYVSRSFTSDGYYTVSRDPDMALEVSFKASHFKHTDLRISTPQDDDLPFLGAVTSSTPSYNVTGSPLGPNRAHLGFTSRTPIMSPPALLPASSYSSSQTPMSQTQFNAYESAIWNVDASTAQLTPAWVNPDGKLVEKAVAVHEPAQGTFAITGENGTGDDAVAVTFYFEFSS